MLTETERAFLRVFIREATTDPFKGPATEELHRRNVYYTDLSDLLAAFYADETTERQDTVGFGGSRSLPSCPWPDHTTAVRRNEEVRRVLKETAREIAR